MCYPSEAQGLDLMCVALGDGGTGWALDSSGSLWFRTGVTYSHPQGEDDHWWQVKSSDFSFKRIITTTIIIIMGIIIILSI